MEARLVENPRYMGTQRSFALSPDGRYLAIASERLDRGGDVRTYGPAIRTGRAASRCGPTTRFCGLDRRCRSKGLRPDPDATPGGGAPPGRSLGYGRQDCA
ncbi:hypothetical protein ASNO1_29430 [Corallococcus caeni]|uniref:Lactonase family protein n=1 Tax=Corallococcus caeni TaxID=3082388 RepID=A0ABQ6QRR5_9BACT|nr:hypothetical protein ASNO1_29430 [Corallococcus sp. NO1]